MKEIFDTYIQSISQKFSYEETSEMGYRTDFENLLSEIFSKINVKRIDHDARAKDGNKPDFVIVQNEVPILYIEAKAIGESLDKIEKSEQMTRYFGYANLVLTDYVEFRFYRNGIPYEEPILLANIDIKNRNLSPQPDNYERLSKTLLDFARSHKEPIKNGEHLAKIMGGKAQRIRDNVKELFQSENKKDAEILRVYETIKKLLVHDLSLDDFADMYAQTLVYGLFVARYHDESQDTFSRQEARDLIPASNPFLRHFFDHIVGPNFEKRLEHIVDELCMVFSHADVKELMERHYGTDLWGEEHEGPDPVIHFYEDFLREYDSGLRKRMGAYYTPTPVVRFIVNSIDQLLESEFNLSRGLADNSKREDGVHRVQVLDPAVGTGTFISAVIRKIYERILKNGQKGTWPSYVHHDLLPRIHGFELMMAPYTIAHLKLSAAFEKTGFKYFNQRLGIYLTNSLEPSEMRDDLFSGFGLSQSISDESREAAKIKNETPIMVVVGNPPYSGISSNETEYANSLVDKYKVEPGGKQKLQERKHWLNDDYVKFISFAESKIAETGEGVMGMITAHGYLDNPTFRGMRWHLMKTFDKIFVLDLHGNSNKKETTPDGGKDENVFNIRTGVSIILAVKHKDNTKELAEVYRSDLYGRQKKKLLTLKELSWKKTEWKQLDPQAPHYYFTSFDYNAEEDYKKFISVAELFPVNVSGIVTARDSFVTDYDKETLVERFERFTNQEYSDEETRHYFFGHKKKGKYLPGDSRGWKMIEARKKLVNNNHKDLVKDIIYRPFDVRKIYYSPDVVDWGREEVMKHYLIGGNLGLMLPKQNKEDWGVLVTAHISAHKTVSAYDINYNFPLYLYSENGVKTPNLKKEIFEEFKDTVGSVNPEDILDYVYATLHSPSYRKKYEEFLKIDFPRVPYPQDRESFLELVEKGRELREIHLLKSSVVNNFQTTFPEGPADPDEGNLVEQYKYKDGKVWINDTQYFGNVPEASWNFWIGGYQPAQKWLKDRKGRKLTNSDIEHWQKIIVALSETDRIMKEIDEIYGR